MTKSAVKRIDATTGSGSNQSNGSEKDVFVHHTALEAERLDLLADGEKLTTDVLALGNGRQSAAELALA